MTFRNLILVLGAASLLSGCAYFVEKPVAGFGDSLNHMVEQQTFDPAAPQAAQASTGLDGQKAAEAVKAYRGEESSTGPQLALPGQ